MRRITVLSILIAYLSLFAACGPSSVNEQANQRPEAPQQEPTEKLTKYGALQQEVTKALDDLAPKGAAIQEYMEAWRSTKAQTAGPQFGGEVQAQKNKILRLCDALESDLDALSHRYQLSQFTGASANVKNLRKLLRDTRKELER